MFGRNKQKTFKDGSEALRLNVSLTRDNQRMCFDITELMSTMSPSEMYSAFLMMAAQTKVWMVIQASKHEPYASARKFLIDTYGNEWWHKLFESRESLDRINGELDKFMQDNYSVDLEKLVNKIKGW